MWSCHFRDTMFCTQRTTVTRPGLAQVVSPIITSFQLFLQSRPTTRNFWQAMVWIWTSSGTKSSKWSSFLAKLETRALTFWFRRDFSLSGDYRCIVTKPVMSTIRSNTTKTTKSRWPRLTGISWTKPTRLVSWTLRPKVCTFKLWNSRKWPCLPSSESFRWQEGAHYRVQSAIIRVRHDGSSRALAQLKSLSNSIIDLLTPFAIFWQDSRIKFSGKQLNWSEWSLSSSQKEEKVMKYFSNSSKLGDWTLWFVCVVECIDARPSCFKSCKERLVAQFD